MASRHEWYTLVRIWWYSLAARAQGELGLNEWALADFIYRQEFIEPQQGIRRLKQRVIQLKKKGFTIERTDNKYRYVVDKDIYF